MLPLSNPAEVAGGKAGVSAGLQYFIGSDPLAVRRYQDDWQGSYHPRSGTNVGLLSARAELGAQAAGWRVSALRQSEVLVQSGREMTDLIRSYKTREAAPTGQIMAADLRYQAYEASGWRIDKAWNWKTAQGSDVAFGLGYSLLDGRRIRTGSAEGSVVNLGAGNYRYAISTDDAYTRKTYPFQTEGQPDGHGGSFNLGISLKTPRGYGLQLTANDVLGRMRWHDIPGTVSTAQTGVTGTDAQGYVVYAPALAGRNARRDFVQRLPLRWMIAGEIPWRDFIFFGSLSKLQETNFPLLGAAWAFANGWRVQADYDLRFRTTGVKLVTPLGFVAARTSDRNLDQAQAYGLSAALTWSF